MGQAVRAESKAIKMAEAHDCAKRNNCCASRNHEQAVLNRENGYAEKALERQVKGAVSGFLHDNPGLLKTIMALNGKVVSGK